MEIHTEIKRWTLWVAASSKIFSPRKIPGAKAVSFQTEEEMIDFGAKLMMKGFKMG